MGTWGGAVVAVSQSPTAGGQHNCVLHKWEVGSLTIAQQMALEMGR